MGEHRRSHPTSPPPAKVGLTVWVPEPDVRRYRAVFAKLEREAAVAGKSAPSFGDFLGLLCQEGFRSVVRQSREEPRRLLVTP